jgi:hypothetical protein
MHGAAELKNARSRLISEKALNAQTNMSMLFKWSYGHGRRLCKKVHWPP